MVHLINAPSWIMDGLRTDPPPPRPAATPVATTGLSLREINGYGSFDPFEWLREHANWPDTLDRHDWMVHSNGGGDVYYTRPDKAVRDGKSAVLHEGGPLVVFTTEVPATLEGLGRPTIDGTGFSVSIVQFICAYEFGGDMALLARTITEQHGPTEAEAATAQRAARTETAPADGDDTPPHQLPGVHPDYWSASARNAHVLAAARAAMVSPDALDLVVFALESLLIPPDYVLPAIVGGRQPLNMLSCLVANTGFFKTSTLDAARDLMGPFPPWVVQIGMGSGEGIGATFLREQTEVSAKTGKTVKTGRLERNPDVQAAFFEADEGRGLSDMAQRSGATIIANLCKAWSGSTLGEANADPAKRRHVLDRDYRIAALVNIQPSAFETLFSASNTGIGLTGRFMFSGTLDADIPDERGPDPGPLAHPDFPKMPIVLEIEQSIIDGAEAEIRRRHRTSSLDSRLDAIGQNAAVVARMAGIACLVDGRRKITSTDWETATLRAQASAHCLAILSEWNAAARRDQRHNQALAKAQTELIVEDVKERQAIARMAEAIRRKASLGGWSRNKLSKAVSSTGTRHRFDAALDLAVSNGWVKVIDGHVDEA